MCCPVWSTSAPPCTTRGCAPEAPCISRCCSAEGGRRGRARRRARDRDGRPHTALVVAVTGRQRPQQVQQPARRARLLPGRRQPHAACGPADARAGQAAAVLPGLPQRGRGARAGRPAGRVRDRRDRSRDDPVHPLRQRQRAHRRQHRSLLRRRLQDQLRPGRPDRQLQELRHQPELPVRRQDLGDHVGETQRPARRRRRSRSTRPRWGTCSRPPAPPTRPTAPRSPRPMSSH